MPATIADTLRLAAADAHAFTCYRSRPASGAAKGGIVLIQEIFGVNRHVRNLADRYAEDGYLVLAPALFDRAEPGIELLYDQEGVARGRELKGKMGYTGPSEDIAEAALWLSQQGLKVGCVGFCWGGDLAWLSARLPKVQAAVAYYGGGIGTLAPDNPPRVPLQLHFGLQDTHIPEKARQAARSAAPSAEYYEYDAGHGFNCEERRDYAPAAAALAQERASAFFGRHLA